MVDNLLPDHVGLPHVLDLAVHLVQLMTWMGRGGHTETFSTVPVDGSYEVLRVTRVLSMEIFSPHMCDAISIENEMKPREIFEKIHFY